MDQRFRSALCCGWLLASCLVVLAAPTMAQSWNLELTSFLVAPTNPPPSGQPFDLLLEVDYNSCQPTVQGVSVAGDSIRIEGLAGPPPDGGCGGGVVTGYWLAVPIEALPPGTYQLDAVFRTRRDGAVAADLQGEVTVGLPVEVPALDGRGLLALLLLCGWLGARRAGGW